MKKALVVFLALAMVASVFAAEPVAGVAINTFTGSETLTWGVDLDTGRTGFKNAADVTFKIDLVAGGTKETSGEGIWGDIQIKTDGDPFFVMNSEADGDTDAVALPPIKIKVDHAKLHIGPAYVGITTGDTTVGEYKLDTAIRAEQEKVSNIGPDGYKYGITAGYAMDGIFSIDVDFRSHPSATNDAIYTNAYALSADAALKMVPNATIKLGGAWNDFGGSVVDPAINAVNNAKNYYDTKSTIAGYVQGDYKFAFGDKFYVKPQVAYTHLTTSDSVSSSKVLTSYLSDKALVSLLPTYTAAEIKAIFKKADPTDAAYINLSAAGFKLVDEDKVSVIMASPVVDLTKQTVVLKDSKNNKGELAGAVLLGWGDKEDSKAGVYLMDIDASKKRIPGFGVTYTRTIYDNTTATVEATVTNIATGKEDTKTFDYTKSVGGSNAITVSAFSGEIVPNLTAAVWYGTTFGEVETKETNQVELDKDVTYGYMGKLVETTTTTNAYTGYEVAAGAKYVIAVGAGKITPQFGIAVADKWNTAAKFATVAGDFGKATTADGKVAGKYVKSAFGTKDKFGNQVQNELVEAVGITNLKIGAEFGGFVPNTTFGIEYTSGNLAANDIKYVTVAQTAKETEEITNKEVGTINITCKISL